MNLTRFTILRSDPLQRMARNRWPHRLFAALLIFALLCVLAPSGLHAQEDAPLYCAALTADDCALLTAAHEQMRTLHALTAANHIDFTASNIPDAPFDAITFALDQQTTQSLSTEAMAALLEFRQLAQTEPQLLMAEPQRLLDFYATFLAGANFESNLQLNVSEDVIRLIEQAAAEEGEPIPFPLPNQVEFSTRLVDGTFYVNLSPLADLLPGLAATGDIWLGVEFAPIIDLAFNAALADADFNDMRSSDAELLAQILGASASNTGGPLAPTLAGMPFGAQALPFLNIQRVEDGAVDGQATARFRTTVNYAALLADPTAQELIAQLIRDPDYGDQPMDEFEMRQTLAIIQQFGPTVLDTLGLELIEQVDLDSGLFLGSELKLNWDVAQLAPLLAAAGIPDLGEDQQLPVIAFSSTTSYRDHNAELTIAPPAPALIIATAELLELIPPAELDFMNSEPPSPPTVAALDDSIAEARALLEAGDPLSALPLFDQAIAVDPNNADAYNERGTVHYRLGDYAAAIEDFSAAIEIDPSDARFYTNRGDAYGQMSEYETALADYDAAIAVDPSYAMAHNNRGYTNYLQGAYEEAVADYTAALELAPDYLQAYANRGDVYRVLGDYEAAIADYNAVLEIDPQSGWVYAPRALAYSELGLYEEAVTDYDAAIAFDDQNANHYFNRALVYYNLGQFDAEIADYTSTLELDPTYTTAYYYRALSYQDLGELELALADYNQALELEPDNTRMLTNRGLLYLDLDETELALADFDQTVALAPDDATGYINRGYTYSLLENYTDALADASQAVELAPDEPIAWGNRAEANGKLGNYEQALADYAQTLELAPDYAIAYLDRGKLYHELGRDEEAIADLEYYLELAPDGKNAAEVAALLEEIR
ncbi:MAG: tetratricopeptide repeat protein [Caldilineaceae bacterium]